MADPKDGRAVDPRVPDDPAEPPPGWRAVGEVTSPSWLRVVQPEADYDPWRERRTHADRRTGQPRPAWLGRMTEDADGKPIARRLATYVEPRPVQTVTPTPPAQRDMPRWMEWVKGKQGRR